ncbi:MAG: 50S ribosomal protein L3 [Dehalococcoidia bacterium]|nr:50S ribosomal protein L3 [Dehalococcoidia bacterium]
MVRGLIGKKIGMTHVFDDSGRMITLTAIECGPCFVTQVKKEEVDGYNAVQLGFCETKRLKSPQKGHLAKNNLGKLRYLREFEADEIGSLEVGQKLNVDLFLGGNSVDVAGISKGKGFAGGVKRHHFAGGPKTHGQSDRHRAPGSVGAGTSPGRVLKGTRMAGHMGSERITERNLKIYKVDLPRNILFVRGAVPGAKGGLLIIKKSLKEDVNADSGS